MKAHFQSDYHQFNLQRKIAGLPTVSQAVFQKATQAEAAKAAGSGQSAYYCKICKKTFNSVQTLGTHLKSRKHLAAKEARREERTQATEVDERDAEETAAAEAPAKVAVLEEESSSTAHAQESTSSSSAPATTDAASKPQDEEMEEDSDDDEKPYIIPTGGCLFCNHTSEEDDVDGCVAHMLNEHSFELPAQDWLTDLPGLVQYLRAKISAGLCLWCNDSTKHFATVQALRNHMDAAGHRIMRWTDAFAEYTEWYDIPESTAILPDGEMHPIDDGKKMALSRDVIHHNHRPLFAINAEKAINNQVKLLTYNGDDAAKRKLVLHARAAHTTPQALMKLEAIRKVQQKTVSKLENRPKYNRTKNDFKVRYNANGPMFRGFDITVHTH
eukprot:TRINITY_DN12293_c0_g1_i1.p1 TRINITY_DN12293_c0_g1~~TRINITY_DN12293_c0_g1_i1.p1  ORF type:complete len:412 (-),score=71.04 TRINITY_DN12293_c0_g1_i1:160-1314(-)